MNPPWYIIGHDPILEMLIVYNEMLEELLEFSDGELIVATGLSQRPYEQ